MEPNLRLPYGRGTAASSSNATIAFGKKRRIVAPQCPKVALSLLILVIETNSAVGQDRAVVPHAARWLLFFEW